MPPLETADRKQDALLWPKSGVNDHGQHVVSSTPTALRVRWVNKQADALDPQGNTIRVDATLITDREIAIGSEVWEGDLGEWVGTGSGEEPNGKCWVATCNVTPDLKNRNTRYEIGLMRSRDTLPTS